MFLARKQGEILLSRIRDLERRMDYAEQNIKRESEIFVEDEDGGMEMSLVGYSGYTWTKKGRTYNIKLVVLELMKHFGLKVVERSGETSLIIKKQDEK